MPSNLFSIIIPTYNYGHYLARAVYSITTQNEKDIEIIIIDDGSTDNTRAIGEQLTSECQSIHYFYQENKGLAASRNAGVRHSNGDYFIFLDADDELLPHALVHYRKAVLAHPDKHFLIGGHQSVDIQGKVRENIPSLILSSLSKQALFSAYLFKKLPISAGGYIMHRTIFQQLQFPEKLRSTEDIPFYAQAIALFDLSFINKALVKVYKHDDSLRHNLELADKIGTDLVDVLFDSKILPGSFMSYQEKYFVKRCLSLSNMAYRSGAYSLSRKWFLAAVNTNKRALLNVSALKRIILGFFKKEAF